MTGPLRNSFNYLLKLGVLPLAVILSSFLLLMGSPGKRQNEARPALMDVFSDFVFVGSGVADSLEAAKHTIKPVDLPLHFQAGNQYVFHYRRSSKQVNIYKLLRDRLLAKGFRITSRDGTADPIQGGPVFRIRFEGNGSKGAIFNRFDRRIINSESLSKEWTEDDYILVLEQI